VNDWMTYGELKVFTYVGVKAHDVHILYSFIIIISFVV